MRSPLVPFPHHPPPPAAFTRVLVQTPVFTEFGSGPRGMAESYGVPFLGKIPMDPNLLKACEDGEAFTTEYADSPAAKPFGRIVKAVVDATQEAVSERRNGVQ